MLLFGMTNVAAIQFR